MTGPTWLPQRESTPARAHSCSPPRDPNDHIGTALTILPTWLNRGRACHDPQRWESVTRLSAIELYARSGAQKASRRAIPARRRRSRAMSYEELGLAAF